MKIKIENILDKFLEKLNLKRIEQKNKGRVIKFDTNSIDTEKEKEETEEKKTRKGSLEENVIKENRRISKRSVSLLTSMVLLLMLTISLGLNSKYVKNEDIVSPKDISSVATSSSVDNNEQMTTDEATEESVFATKATPKKVEEKLIFSVPISGEIQKMYSTDKVIYSKTLGQWKTHDGLDIAADLGDEVYSIERGVVDDVYNDSFYGTTIVIEHISGYISKYSNLDEEVYVNIGESVVKGQKIGKVGNTSVGEYLDSPHLHFMLYLNDISIDPTYIYN